MCSFLKHPNATQALQLSQAFMADNAHIMVFHVITPRRIIGSYVCSAVSVKCSTSVFNSRKSRLFRWLTKWVDRR